MMASHFLLASVLLSALAAVFDWRSGHIPNWLTLGGLCGAVLIHAVNACLLQGIAALPAALGSAALGALLCALGPALMFWLGGMGGGDVKLFAAIGAFGPPLVGLEAQSYSFIIALLLAPAYLAYQGRLLQTLGNTLALLANPFRRKERRRPMPDELMSWMRLGPAIFLGTLTTFVLHAVVV